MPLFCSLIPTVLTLGGCAGPLSVLDPAGPHAAAVATLWWVMLSGAVLLAGLVFALLAIAMVRRHGEGRAAERTWIVGLGLAMPCAVLLALLGYALFVGGRILPTPAPDTVAIAVDARRYGWEFSHPGGRSTQGVMHIPAGRPVDLVITSRDVIHSVWIPRLAGKMDAIPGHTNRLRIVAAAPGTYRGECAEYCGTGHRDHSFTVIAHDAAGWAPWRQGR